MYERREKITTRTCKTCGKDFETNKFRAKKYCSTNCYSSKRKKFNGEELVCEVCGKTFIQKGPNHKRCSILCTNEFYSFNYQLKNFPEGDRYPFLRLRFEIFKRDNFTCQYCGRNVKDDKIKLNCDHIVPRKLGGKDVLNNLITACAECNCGKSDIMLEKNLLK